MYGYFCNLVLEIQPKSGTFERSGIYWGKLEGWAGMLGLRSDQRGLFEADHLYLDYVGGDSFYGFLASQRGRLFRDEEFAELYCPDNGRR